MSSRGSGVNIEIGKAKEIIGKRNLIPTQGAKIRHASLPDETD